VTVSGKARSIRAKPARNLGPSFARVL
jgi:hypothetical protein